MAVRWLSGLRRLLGEQVYGKPYRGFKSHPHRHARERAEEFRPLRNVIVIDNFLSEGIAKLCGGINYKKGRKNVL